MYDKLDGTGLEPHKCKFRISQNGDAVPGFSLESRQLFFSVFMTPIWPRPIVEFKLGDFQCVGCVFERGIKVWGPLGCPVHTPSQSWPITDALVKLVSKP